MVRTFLIAPLLGACTFPIDGASVVDRRVIELEVTDETAVELVTRSGGLDVIGEVGRTTVELDVTLVRQGGPIGRSDQAGIDALVATLEASGGVIEARSYVDLWGNNPFGTDAVLRVPADFDAVVDDTSGELSVLGVASLDLRDDSGSAAVADVPGEVVIDDASGDLTIDGTGPLTIRDDSGSIEADRVDGDVWIRDASGDVRLSTVDGDVEIIDDSGSIWVRDVTGTVRVDDASGDITIEDVGDFELISDSSGSVFRR